MAIVEPPFSPVTNEPLAEALQFLRMDGLFYCRSELTAPWGVTLPAMNDCLWFHVVTSGRCVLADSEGREHHLVAGDVLVLPHGAGHIAYDQSSSEKPVVFDLPHDYVSSQYAVLRHGGGGEATELICGMVQFGHPAGRRLVELLPEMIRIERATSSPEWQWLPGLTALMASETQTMRPGSEAVVTRLCDILVIQAIRSWIDTDPAANEGWIGALRDPAIGRAITLIHRHPERDWTVDSLAAAVSMSRSGFSARFSSLVGRSPKQYVTEWRMMLADDLLRGDGSSQQLSILEIALRLGYMSEAAFSRAFKRERGVPPSKARFSAPLMPEL